MTAKLIQNRQLVLSRILVKLDTHGETPDLMITTPIPITTQLATEKAIFKTTKKSQQLSSSRRRPTLSKSGKRKNKNKRKNRRKHKTKKNKRRNKGSKSDKKSRRRHQRRRNPRDVKSTEAERSIDIIQTATDNPLHLNYLLNE